jgi:DNA-binding Lrp family transcriptional regulator
MKVDTTTFIHAYINAYKKGNSINDLAKELGISPSGIQSRINRLTKGGLQIPKLNAKNLVVKIKDILNEYDCSNLNEQTAQNKILEICLEEIQYAKKIIKNLLKLKHPIFTEEFKNKIIASAL